MNHGNKADVYFMALLVPILLHVILLWNLIIFIYMKHYLIQALYVSNNLIMYWKKSFQCLETCSAWLKTWHCRFRNNMQVHKKVNEKRNKMAKFINCLSKSNSLSFNYKYVLSPISKYKYKLYNTQSFKCPEIIGGYSRASTSLAQI